MFTFDPICARPSTGSFKLSESLRRRLFTALGDQATLFGLRYFGDGMRIENVGLFDARRSELQERFAEIGRGVRQVSSLSSMFQPNTGCTINSPQLFGRPHDDQDAFQEISDLFLSGLNLPFGGHPESIFTTFYLGNYNMGFGLHTDPGEDTALFVLDGTKRFVVVVDGKEQMYTVEQNEYLAWTSEQPHSAANSDCPWSMTVNFAVGSPGVDGPVKYCHPATKRVLAFAQ